MGLLKLLVGSSEIAKTHCFGRIYDWGNHPLCQRFLHLFSLASDSDITVVQKVTQSDCLQNRIWDGCGSLNREENLRVAELLTRLTAVQLRVVDISSGYFLHIKVF